MNSTATDPDFGAYLVMATDESTASANEGSASPWAASWDMGSAGEWDAFSLDSSMLMVGNNSGNWAVLYLNPTSIHNKTCAPIPCVSNSGVGTNGTKAGDTYHLASNGSYSFSRVPGETNIIYEYYNPVATQVQVNKVAVCQNGTSSPNCTGWTGPGPLYRTTYKDFSYTTGTQVLPANYYTAGASSTFTTANDGSVAIAIGGGVDWQASWVPAVNTILFPQAGNTNKGWQAIAVTGPTGSTEPTWSGCQTTIYVTTCSDGGVTWEYIGNVGSSQGSYFDIIGYHPGTGSYHLDTRTGIINRGTDSSAPAGAATTNDAIACTRYANGGTVTYPCPLPDVYTLHDFSQSMNGRYVIIAPDGAEGANASGNWDWGTLSGQTSNKVWEGAWSATQSYSKNQVVSNNGYFYSVTATTAPAGNAPPTPPTLSNSYWAQSEAWPAVYYWDVTGTLISPCTDYLNCNGHTAQGYIAQYWGGKYAKAQFGDETGLLPGPVSNLGALYPDTKLLAATLPADQHGSYRNAGTNDLPPVFIVNTNVPAWYTNYTAACYTELCATSTDGLHTLYRFAHSYNTGSVVSFQVQNNIGVCSYLGDLCAIGTDIMGKRGTNTASNTVCPASSYATGPAASYPPRGMYQPSTGNAVNYQDTMMVLSTLYIYQAQAFWNSGTSSYVYSGSGAEGSTLPAWATACGTAGSYCTTDGTTGTAPLDGNVLWQNLGQNTCRGDVMIVDVLSAHPAP